MRVHWKCPLGGASTSCGGAQALDGMVRLLIQVRVVSYEACSNRTIFPPDLDAGAFERRDGLRLCLRKRGGEGSEGGGVQAKRSE